MKKTLSVVMLLIGVSISLTTFAGLAQNQKDCDAGDAGDAKGCYELGLMYYEGQGVKQDNAKAKILFGRACDGHYEPGCKAYAELNTAPYDKVNDERSNTKKYWEDIRPAVLAARYILIGYMYEQGKGFKQDYAKAVELYTKAKMLFGKACDDHNDESACKAYAVFNTAGY